MTKRLEPNKTKNYNSKFKIILSLFVVILGTGFWVWGFAKNDDTPTRLGRGTPTTQSREGTQYIPFLSSDSKTFENYSLAPLLPQYPGKPMIPLFPLIQEKNDSTIVFSLNQKGNIKSALANVPEGNWVGDGLCYQQGLPTGRTGSNFTGIACDGLHEACLTDKPCVGSGFCFFDPIDEICYEESCIGKCGFDAYIWDPETSDCGCNTGYLKEERHAEKRCEDLKGSVESDRKGKNFCAYNGRCEEEDCLGEGKKESCKFVDKLNKQAWKQYENWSATSPKICTGAISGLQPACATGAHGFGNQAVEECRFIKNAAITPGACSATLQTCKAEVTQIGCTGGVNCHDAGGIETSDGGVTFCQFNQISCPAGWTQFQNWSTTNPQTCSGTVSSNPPFECTTSSHALSNDPTRETCDYIKNVTVTETSCNAIQDTCIAPVTQVGCY